MGSEEVAGALSRRCLRRTILAALCCANLWLAGCGGGGAGPSAGDAPTGPAPAAKARLELVVGPIGGAGNLDGQGSAARFSAPHSAVSDAQGNVYVADTGNRTVRKITPDGWVSTLAGNPTADADMVDGTGAAARFYYPEKLMRGAQGRLVVVDGGGGVIALRRVSADGTVSTWATLDSTIHDVAVGANDQLYGVRILSEYVRFDPNANSSVYRYDQSVVKIQLAADGRVTAMEKVAGIGSQGESYAPIRLFQGANHEVYAYWRDPDMPSRFFSIDATGGAQATPVPQSQFDPHTFCSYAYYCHVTSLAADSQGAVYLGIEDDMDGKPAKAIVVKVEPSGLVTQVGGEQDAIDGPLAAARFELVTGITSGTGGRLIVVDRGNDALRTIDWASGRVDTLAGAPRTRELERAAQRSVRTDLPLDKRRNYRNHVMDLEPLNKLHDVLVTPDGKEVYFNFGQHLSGYGDSMVVHRWRDGALDSVHTPVTHFGDWGYPFRITMDRSKNIYARGIGFPGHSTGEVARLNDRFFGSGLPICFSQDFGAFPYATALFEPAVGDWSMYLGSCGLLDTVTSKNPGVPPWPLAMALDSIQGLATDKDGNVYVASSGHQRYPYHPKVAVVYKVTPQSVVSTLAGRPGVLGDTDGPANVASFKALGGLTVDRAGNVYVADSGNHTVRKIAPDGTVSTVAGRPGQQGNRLGELPAYLDTPLGVDIDDNNVLYIATPGAILKVQLPQ